MRTTPTTTVLVLSLTAGVGYLTARRTYHRQLAAARHAATHDPLTGLVNRAGLTTRADHLLTAPGGVVAVAVIDLVGFKVINDTHGHDAGDQVLTTTATRLTTAAAPGLAARLGGDEFTVLCPVPPAHRHDPYGWLTGWVSTLHTRLTRPVPYRSSTVAVGATIGATVADQGSPLAVWLHEADLAMYTARATRRTTAITNPANTSAAAAAGVTAPKPGGTFTGTTARAVTGSGRVRDLARPTSHLTTAA